MQRETTNTLDRSTPQFVFALQGALRRRGAGLALWGTSWAEAARLGFSFAREDAGGFIKLMRSPGDACLPEACS